MVVSVFTYIQARRLWYGSEAKCMLRICSSRKGQQQNANAMSNAQHTAAGGGEGKEGNGGKIGYAETWVCVNCTHSNCGMSTNKPRFMARKKRGVAAVKVRLESNSNAIARLIHATSCASEYQVRAATPRRTQCDKRAAGIR